MALTNVTWSTSLDTIPRETFAFCRSLRNITIPQTIRLIEKRAFYYCTKLTGVYFEGTPPKLGSDWVMQDEWDDLEVFDMAFDAVVYYVPGTPDWGPAFAHLPTMPWIRPIAPYLTDFAIGTNGFSFTIQGSTNQVVVVEACLSMANPSWSSISTNTLADGMCHFSDPDWHEYPARFYRVRN